MSQENYSIKQIGPSQFDLLLPLMKDCFGLAVDINYFTWKYTQNPAGDFIGFVAVRNDTGEIGAYYGVIPERFVINGQEKIVYQSCDTMTHSKHRRLGLFQLLALHCYEYLEAEGKLMIYGYGGGQSTPGFIKFGWAHLFDMVSLFYPRQFNLFRFFGSGKNSRDVMVVDSPEVLNELIEKSNLGSDIRACKKKENFIWRLSNPLRKYKILVSRDGTEKLTGYAVYYESGDKLFLFDWYFLTKQSERKLIGAMKNEMARDKKMKGIITLVKKGAPVHKVLKRNWFVYNPFKKGPLHEKTPFIVYAKGKDADLFLSPALWQPMPYDHDSL